MLKKYPWVEVPLRNGVLAGLLGIALLLGLYYMDRHPFLIPVYMDFRIILFAVFIFFSLKEVRDYFQAGALSFVQGMLMSLLFTIIFAVLGFLILWGFATWKPAFVTTYIALAQEQTRMIPPEIIARIGKSSYENTLRALPATRGIDLAFLYLWQSFVISFFLSIIISVILRRQPKPQ